MHPLEFRKMNLMRWLTFAVLVGAITSAVAQPSDSIVATGSLLMGCRAFVENDPNGDQMQMGACAGATRAALDISRSLRRACPPESVGVIDVSRVVIGFVDERPERKSEDVGRLISTAL